MGVKYECGRDDCNFTDKLEKFETLEGQKDIYVKCPVCSEYSIPIERCEPCVRDKCCPDCGIVD